MNCKQGDLAIIVKSFAGNEGKIVRCASYYGPHWFAGLGKVPTWVLDRELTDMYGGTGRLIADSQLRPIRPDSEPTSFESHRELEAA